MPYDASLSAVPHVLLVGAGAMGVITGYQLQLACAEVMFLVRPARATVNHSAGYRVISDVSEVADQTYEYGIVTLDGASSYSVEGTTLLNHLGDAVRGSSATVVIGGIVVPRDRPAGRPRWASAPVAPAGPRHPGSEWGTASAGAR